MAADRARTAQQIDVLAQAQTQLDAWRQAGADRHAPTRFAFLSALTARTGRLTGNARKTLETRLTALLEEYAALLSEASAKAPKAGKRVPRQPAQRPLLALVEQLGRQAQGLQAPVVAASSAAVEAPQAPAEMPALEAFRGIWNSVRSERQVRRTLEQAPVGAGPLNSTALAHRAITLMQACSPGYLQHFLAHVDTLSWLEQMQLGGVLATTATGSAGAAPAKKPARKATRSRRKAADTEPGES